MNKTRKFQKNRKKISFTFVLKLTKTIILTLCIFCILMIILYTVGNYQDFQDKSQQIILNTLSYTSIITLFLTIPVIIESTIRLFTVKKKSESIITIILMLITILIMIGCISISSVISFLSQGF